MDQAGILRKFIQSVKAMSEGDEERGEDNFGSDFMVGQHLAADLAPLAFKPISTRPLWLYNFHLSLSTDPPFLTTPPPPFPSLVSVYPSGGEAGAATLPSSFSSRFQALHGGLALSLIPQKAGCCFFTIKPQTIRPIYVSSKPLACFYMALLG